MSFMSDKLISKVQSLKPLKGKSGTCVQNKINIVQNAQLKKDFQTISVEFEHLFKIPGSSGHE